MASKQCNFWVRCPHTATVLQLLSEVCYLSLGCLVALLFQLPVLKCIEVLRTPHSPWSVRAHQMVVLHQGQSCRRWPPCGSFSMGVGEFIKIGRGTLNWSTEAARKCTHREVGKREVMQCSQELGARIQLYSRAHVRWNSCLITLEGSKWPQVFAKRLQGRILSSINVSQAPMFQRLLACMSSVMISFHCWAASGLAFMSSCDGCKYLAFTLKSSNDARACATNGSLLAAWYPLSVPQNWQLTSLLGK